MQNKDSLKSLLMDPNHRQYQMQNLQSSFATDGLMSAHMLGSKQSLDNIVQVTNARPPPYPHPHSTLPPPCLG